MIAALLLGIPALLFVGAYLWLAVDRGTLLLWNVPVHESGRFTLAGTALYVEHFLREIPIAVAYALFLVAALARSSGAAPARTAPERAPELRPTSRPENSAGDRVGPGDRGPTTTLGWSALALAALMAAVAAGVTAARSGWGTVWIELLQYRTRPELLDPGSHWRFHWLSTLWFGVAAHLLVPPVLRAAGIGHGRPADSDRTSSTPVGLDGAVSLEGGGSALPRPGTWTLLAWGYFVALTLAFGVSAEVFTDLRYVGHQAREIATHGPVTLLLALGAVLATGWSGGSSTPADRGERGFSGRPTRWTLAVPFVGIPAYLAVVALSGDVMGAGQTDQGLSAMVAGHLFEHTLDYFFVTFLTVSGCAWMAHRPPARPD